MIAVTTPTLLALTAVAGVAGFVDAIAGGGGLLCLPALLLAGLPPQLALGTNKGQAVFGSGAALARFSRSPLLDRGRAGVGFAAGFAGALLGSRVVLRVPAKSLEPVVVVALVVVAIFLLLRRPAAARRAAPRSRPVWLALAVAAVIGVYDGLFGPGTGTFLIMIYAWLWSESLTAASANAKVVNFASNLAALLGFAVGGAVFWPVALPMAAAQLTGGWLGAHLTLRSGEGLVRRLAIVVSLALVVRLVWVWAH